MNIKLIIFWVFSIIVFTIIGVFGYVNQDLLHIRDVLDEESKPVVDENIVVHNCKSVLEKGDIAYKYIIKDNKIDKTSVTFEATNVKVDDYMLATNINNFSSEGITTSLSNGALDFKLVVTMDHSISSYDFTSIQEDLNGLGINLNKIDNYNDVVISLGDTFTCE